MLATLALSLSPSPYRPFVRSFVGAEMNRKVKIARGRKIPCKVSGGGAVVLACVRAYEHRPADSGT